MNPTTVQALEAFPAQLEAHFAAVPAGFTSWTPAAWDGMPSEHLSAIEQVCHVRDIEVDGYHVRIRRMLTETHPTLESLDSEGLAVERAYASADAAAALQAFRRARTRTLAMLSPLTAEQWARTAQFDGYGTLTLRGLVHFLCSHDQQHLAGLQWLMGKIEGA